MANRTRQDQFDRDYERNPRFDDRDIRNFDQGSENFDRNDYENRYSTGGGSNTGYGRTEVYRPSDQNRYSESNRNFEQGRDFGRTRNYGQGGGYEQYENRSRQIESGDFGTRDYSSGSSSQDHSRGGQDYSSRSNQDSNFNYGNRPQNYYSEHGATFRTNYNTSSNPDYGRTQQSRWGGQPDWNSENDWRTRSGNPSNFGSGSRDNLYTNSSYGTNAGPGYGGGRGQFSGRGPKNYQRSDERIREDIIERLTIHPAIDASEIEVQVKNCEVTLTGTVDNREDRRLAEDVAEQVWGVRDVHNQIKANRTSMWDRITGTEGSTSGDRTKKDKAA